MTLTLALPTGCAKRFQCKRLLTDAERLQRRRVADWRIKVLPCIVVTTVITTFGARAPRRV
ncbi:hypothetical protein BN2475_320036 [Paraburkholderia ribeironis]|uniref:Uncharacterized protein n=1 Tax=Paraburkholderia ribeironis TaxID=1247936 RepID=A0A1N7S388_9BURK|nr:hypothetical protein BN2475_320036 [Paraburkholderia ribeironis]